MSPHLLILGAGPAGLAAALTLRALAPRFAVTVLAGPSQPREKIGETLPPGAQALLHSLGVWDAFLASDPLPAYGTASAWGDACVEANEFIFHPERRGWHIERGSFDALLAREAERRGITVRRGATVGAASFDGTRWSATLHDAEHAPHPLAPEFVIDATGRAAVFAERAGARRFADDRLVAISVTLRPAADAPLRDTYALVETSPLGWWYSALQPDGRLAVALFTDADLARVHGLKSPGAWLAALCCAPHTFRRCHHAAPQAAPVLHAADTAMLDRIVDASWLATGDAALTFDPLSSQGIVKALREGTLAAYATIDHLAGDAHALPKYEALLRREHRAFLTAKREFYGRETRWPHAHFWARRREVPHTVASSEPALQPA